MSTEAVVACCVVFVGLVAWLVWSVKDARDERERWRRWRLPENIEARRRAPWGVRFEAPWEDRKTRQGLKWLREHQRRDQTGEP